MTLDCGCEIDYDGDLRGGRMVDCSTVLFCPLHEHADEMEQALARIEIHLRAQAAGFAEIGWSAQSARAAEDAGSIGVLLRKTRGEPLCVVTGCAGEADQPCDKCGEPVCGDHATVGEIVVCEPCREEGR